MGLLGKLKLPQLPGGTGSQEKAPKSPPRPPAKGGVSNSTGGVADAVRKAVKSVQGAGNKVPEAPPPKKRGGVAQAVEAAALVVRVQEADKRMEAALAAANSVGTPLNNRTQGEPDSKARKVWQATMVKYWQPGSAARQQALSLQGNARIAKAEEATALLGQARAFFQQGLGLLG